MVKEGVQRKLHGENSDMFLVSMGWCIGAVEFGYIASKLIGMSNDGLKPHPTARLLPLCLSWTIFG
ncbi:hypothetical protein RYX36_032281 [Vicia faba]